MTGIDKFYTISEFATKLRVHENTVRRAIKSGRIQAVRLGGGYRIADTEVQRLCELDVMKLIEEIVDRKLEERK